MTASSTVSSGPAGDPIVAGGLDFELPPDLSADAPPEARGLPRDAVRLMMSRAENDHIEHRNFTELPELLRPGDLLLVNTSATINASLAGWRPAGDRLDERVELHLSTPVPDGRASEWVVELRALEDVGTVPLLGAAAGERLVLDGGGEALLLEPYRRDGRGALAGDVPPGASKAVTPAKTGGRQSPLQNQSDDSSSPNLAAPPRGSGKDGAGGGLSAGVRLWRAELELPTDLMDFTARYGSPIRYRYVRDPWPLAMYQTIFAAEPGSAEMPSAGRPFTRRVLDRLIARGVAIAPVVLHTGVASLEAHEPPYPERFDVPHSTADAVRAARAVGGRVIAVGTTVVRAIESAALPDGSVTASSGWTDLIITPERGVHVVDGLLTGLHEPRSSHLMLLEALAGRPHLEAVYREALRGRYLWHEFGDLHLLLRRGRGG